MITFDDGHYTKFQDASISGTGYLAYRDIPKIIDLYKINLNKILDFGCASGRSTNFLNKLSKLVCACDISPRAVSIVKKSITNKAFINNLKSDFYQYYPYTSIFTFFTFLHLTSKEEIIDELKRCNNSLEYNGFLTIVTAHKNLFYKNYVSVGCIDNNPNLDGDITQIKLKKIDCEVTNCFWEYSTLSELANQCGFNIAGIHFPVGDQIDKQDYIDEYSFSPYVYLVLKKHETKFLPIGNRF